MRPFSFQELRKMFVSIFDLLPLRYFQLNTDFKWFADDCSVLLYILHSAPTFLETGL